MAWLSVNKAPLKKSERIDTPDGLWHKCRSCGSVLYQEELISNYCVCPRCEHHYPISPEERIQSFLDPQSFVECDADLRSSNPLEFVDQKPYSKRLEGAQKKTVHGDALISGSGLLLGRKVELAIFDFRFMGGSMGTVVGEKIARTFMRAKERRHPAIVFSSSGGARMQEGILSLMQMAKTCAALSLLREAGLPMISIMTHPTTGGVAASYAMLGDINVAEPGALIGFAGPRVIRQTIGERLPEGFQTSEYLLEHGMLDFICPRMALRTRVSACLEILCGGLWEDGYSATS